MRKLIIGNNRILNISILLMLHISITLSTKLVFLLPKPDYSKLINMNII